MKISTSYLFDSATSRMSTLQNKLANTQAQLAESKQVLSPSDAPDQAAAIQRLQGEIDRQNSHQNLLKNALSRYQAEEAAMSSASDILIRLKELSLQASNDTLNSNDRNSIAVEMSALRDQLFSLGNTRDDNGNYLFSGTRVNAAAFTRNSNDQVLYQGDQTLTRIPAGVERTVQFTRSGSDVFQRVVRPDGESLSFFDALKEVIQATLDGDSEAMRQGTDDLTKMHSAMSLAQAQNGSDQNTVESQLNVLEQNSLRLKSTLSDIQDLDYAEAVTRMNKEMMAMQAAMSSFAKISGLSLFDYIKG